MSIAIDQSLQSMKVRYVAPWLRRFDAFWSWWSAELHALLPPALQSVLSQRTQRTFLEVTDDELVTWRGTIAERRELARVSLPLPDAVELSVPDDAPEAVLLLPADKVLVRPMSLPLATEENLREVLSFEMDRQTPFSADQVWYDHMVTKRDPAAGRLELSLVATPRSCVDELLRTLGELGVFPERMTTRDASGTGCLPVNLLPAPDPGTRGKTIRRANAALGLLALALLAVAVTLPLLQKRQLLAELEPQLTEAIAQARSADELRTELERLAQGAGYLVRKKRDQLSMLEIMNEVSRALPDHTWLARADIGATAIQLQGQSSSSATLISLLEASPMFRNVRFRSPVIRIPTSGEERFHLSADIEYEVAQ